MPVDPSGLFDAIMAGLSKVPSALIAAALLAGPTAIWLIARFVNPPDLAGKRELVLEELLWVCSSCRSINEDLIENCYRCHRPRADESLPLVVAAGEVRAAPGVGIAVGPGRPAADRSGRSWIEHDVAAASQAADEAAAVEEAERLAELASLAYEPVILEPRVKVSGHPAPRTRSRKRKAER
jgi:hypothetical protein